MELDDFEASRDATRERQNELLVQASRYRKLGFWFVTWAVIATLGHVWMLLALLLPAFVWSMAMLSTANHHASNLLRDLEGLEASFAAGSRDEIEVSALLLNSSLAATRRITAVDRRIDELPWH